MVNYIKIGLVLFLGLASFYSTAQEEKTRTSSYLTYVYQLTTEEAVELTGKYYYKPNAELLHSKVDSFLTDSGAISLNPLPNGHYLMVYTEKDRLKTSYFAVTHLNIDVLNSLADFAVLVHTNNSLESIPDAVVTLKNKQLKYNSETQTYSLKNTKREGVLIVATLGDTAVIDISNYSNNTNWRWRRVTYPFRRVYYAIIKRDRFEQYQGSAKGYLAFSKPIYRINDTLKWKAFIVKKNGKPYHKEVKVYVLPQYDYNNRVGGSLLKPTSKGAYSSEFLLHDSLQIDRRYEVLMVTRKKEKTIYRESFYLEDYQLNEVEYSIRSNKEYYKVGESIVIYASGKDANGFSVRDGSAKISLKTDKVTEFVGDTIFVPNTLWDSSFVLDPLGETKIRIPENLIPKVNMRVQVEVVFKNSNNEIHEEELVFTYESVTTWIESEIISDTIYADYLQKGVASSSSGWIYRIINRDTISTNRIELPYQEKIDPSITLYAFKTDNSQYFNWVKDSDSEVQCFRYRSSDSVYFMFENPHKVKIHYSIYKNNNLISEGVVTELDTVLADKSNQVYSILYHYNWGGITNSQNFSIQKYDNNLKVRIEQPSRIYPGQKVDLKVTVTDNKNKPAENVNILAVSVNGQFQKKQELSVPYLGKYYYKSSRVNYYNRDRVDANSSSGIGVTHQMMFHLDTIDYYKYIFPENGLYFHRDITLGITNAQFSPYVFSRGYEMEIQMVYVDDEIVYYSEASRYEPYSIIVPEGCHTIKMRTRNKLYTIRNVCIRDGEKLDFSIDAINFPEKVTAVDMPKYFTDYELAVLNRSILQIENSFRAETAFFWQKGEIRSNYQRGYSSGFLVGPFYQDSVHFVLTNEFKSSFIFEPGYRYYLEKGMVKLKESSLFTSEIQLNWSRDTHKFEQVKQPVKVIHKSIKLDQPSRYLLDYSYLTVEGNGDLEIEYLGDSSIYIMQLQKMDSPIISRFYDGDSRNFANIPPGQYQLMMVTNHRSYLVKDEFTILPDGYNFIRVTDSDLLVIESEKELTNHGFIGEINDSSILSFLLGDSVGGMVSGIVTDKETGEPLPFVVLIIESNGVEITGGVSDFDGKFIFRNLPPGVYDLKAMSVGYGPVLIVRLRVGNAKISPINVQMQSSAIQMESFVVVAYSNKLVDSDNTYSKQVVTMEDFKNMACRSAVGVAKNTAGVYAMDNGYGNLNIRGARSDANYYYIDGMKVVGSSNLPKAAISELVVFSLDGIDDPKSEFEGELLRVQSSGIRSNFSDNGYWQPNLLTDKYGEVTFQVTFPGNVTKWETTILAMDGKKRSGKGYIETIAYKPLLAQLSVPRFLLVGDQTNVIGKVTNYEDGVDSIHTYLQLNEDTLYSDAVTTEATIINRFSITAADRDSLSLSYSLKKKTGYYDGEEREIPVFPVGVKETKGGFYVLRGDTTIEIVKDDFTGDIHISAQSDVLHQMLKEIETLEQYPYYCMEQSASKLTGYLLKQQIQESIGEPFKNKRDIRKLLRRLESGQNDDGGWGWWPTSSTTNWMTIYVLKALNMATDLGYEVDDIDEANQYVLWQLDGMSTNDLLFALLTLSDYDVEVPYKSYLRTLNKEKLNMYQTFMRLRIEQNIGMEVDIEKVISLANQTIFGNYYWSGTKYGWYENTNSITLLAYQIIAHNDSSSLYLSLVRDYFLEANGKGMWSNTIDRAQILKTVIPSFIKENEGKLMAPELIFSGDTKPISLFPFDTILSISDESILVRKTGTSTVYLTAYQNFWNENPARNDSLYAIETWFERDGKVVDSLVAGELVELKVKVNVKKKSDYVMIEIPIPAGCSYGDNRSNSLYFESHREYYKNKTSVFCESITEGEHVFTISLQPRFSGIYTLNPVRAEMMYFPVLYGNNQVKKSVIK